MSLAEGIVGLNPAKYGRRNAGPMGLSEWSTGALVQESGGRYGDSCWNKEVFTLSSGLVATPAAGPLAAGGTPLLALWNPQQSGYQVFVRRIGAFWSALGTTSGKGFEIDIGPTAPITQGTVISGINNDSTGDKDTDLIGFSNVALTSSTLLARLRPLNTIGNGAAAAFMASPNGEEVSDSIMIQQGCVLAITALALGVANEAIAFIEYAKRAL